MSAPRPLRALCLDGGGYLGLATASFIAETERHFGTKFADQFDLFCGTSTGGILALGLASGMSGEELVGLYRRLGHEVFSNRLPGQRQLRIAWGLFFSKYSNKPLAEALTDVFGDRSLGDIKARGKFVVVPAFCLSSGTPRVFKTDHTPELSRDDKHLIRNIALATSAAPTYLPIVSIRSPTSGAFEQFVDGGIFANNPVLLALTEAVGYFRRPPAEIEILSLATPRDLRRVTEKSRSLSRLEKFRLSRGLLMWGSALADLFVGASMQLSHFAVNRVMLQLVGEAGAYARVELPSQEGLELDEASSWATETLINIGNHAATSGDTRKSLERFMNRGG